MAGTSLGAAVSSTLTAHLTTPDGLILIGSVTGGAPPDTAGIFAVGAIVSRTGSGGGAVYVNTGTTAAPTWSTVTVS